MKDFAFQIGSNLKVSLLQTTGLKFFALINRIIGYNPFVLISMLFMFYRIIANSLLNQTY